MIRSLLIGGCAAAAVLLSACSAPATSSPATPAAPTPAAAAPGNPYGAAPAAPAAAGQAAAGQATGGPSVMTAQTPLGTILTDGHGRAVYLFEADTGSTSTCSGGCAAVWPPLSTTAAPVAGPGLTAGLLGTSPRPDGTTQLTYHGHPLYYFVKDTGPGTTAGQGITNFGASWYVLTPSGTKIDNG